MKDNISDEDNENIIYAYEPDLTLRELIGHATPIASIFNREIILECQNLIDEAKQSFFQTSQEDVDILTNIIDNPDYTQNYCELCKQIYQPACNIKGQAEIFGFRLVSQLCKYLIEYSQNCDNQKKYADKDILIIKNLVKALATAFKEKIIDSGREIEKKLISAVNQAKK